MQNLLDQLRTATDTDDVHTTVTNLIEVLCDERDRLVEENAALNARVTRLERWATAVGAAAEVIGPRRGE